MSADISIPTTAEAALIRELQIALAAANLRISDLEEQLRLQRIRKYGPPSEKLSGVQLALLEEEPGVSNAEVQGESARPPLPDATEPASTRRRPKHPGRQSLPENLPRVEETIPCPPEQCKCKACGKEMPVIGYDQSEQLDAEPVKYFVRVIKREKRACRCCEQGTVATAPVAPRIVEKGLASNNIVVGTVVSKYEAHLPLYRQSVILERETGIAISRATMDGWVMRVGELLVPVTAAMRRELLADGYIQADETPVGVQMHDGRGQNHQAYLWQYGQPGGGVVFDFRMGRAREGPSLFLGKYEGLLQTDGYGAYDKVGGPKLVHAACWAHARRKFFEAHKLDPGEESAKEILATIDRLFAVDGEARARKLDVPGRDALRQERARSVVSEIKQQVQTVQSRALPSSRLGKAAAYTLGLWPKLTRFLAHPRLELSNNLAENSMRPVAVGRKNWIHVGSAQAGPKVAAILSVVESCRRLGVGVREYLAGVLPGLADVSVQRIRELTPAAWAARAR